MPPPAGDERVTASILDGFERAIRVADSSTRLVLSDPEKANEAARAGVLMMNEVGARLEASLVESRVQAQVLSAVERYLEIEDLRHTSVDYC